MRLLPYSPMLVASLLSIAGTTSATAEPRSPWVQLEATSVMLGVGGQSGDGMLRLPNLGTNCAYPFKVDGFGAGLHVGISKVAASGIVENMKNLGDLIGDYAATQGEATLIAGAGAISMQNRANHVMIGLQSNTRGVALGFGAQGMSIKMDVPASDAPHIYVVEFGFDKDWIGAESRAKLAQAIDAWKCRFAHIEVVGHTDTVGKEDENLELADQRAKAVRDYLIGAGFVADRITTRSAGSSEPLVDLGPGMRARVNRAVVLYVHT